MAMLVILKGMRWDGSLLLNNIQHDPYWHLVLNSALTKLGMPVSWFGKITASALDI